MSILIKPLVTEKATAQSENLNMYGFLVEQTANKIQIKKAVEELYGVKVASVNTIRYGGKNRSRYTKSGVISGRTKSFKKAIVTLPKGESIDFFSNI
ncbi:MAG: 50S ribosomal protein L23 [Bacteroidales bacterium]|nr:50S ribosomal protein L23 [Bacteroidales bacterium]